MNDLKYKIEGGLLVNRLSNEAIPEDEPVFILRARDALSIYALEDYRDLCEADNCAYEHMDLIHRDIMRFRKWQREYADKVRQPGRSRRVHTEVV